MNSPHAVTHSLLLQLHLESLLKKLLAFQFHSERVTLFL